MPHECRKVQLFNKTGSFTGGGTFDLGQPVSVPGMIYALEVHWNSDGAGGTGAYRFRTVADDGSLIGFYTRTSSGVLAQGHTGDTIALAIADMLVPFELFQTAHYWDKPFPMFGNRLQVDFTFSAVTPGVNAHARILAWCVI